jgi:hypothetical protein
LQEISTCATSCSWPPSSLPAAATRPPRPLALCACTPGTCGGFAQNQATVKSGAARIKVYYGQLTNHIAAFSYLGSITVAHGYSDGPIWNGNAPYLFPPGAVLTGHFYLNDDSVPNTQFVSCLPL